MKRLKQLLKNLWTLTQVDIQKITIENQRTRERVLRENFKNAADI